MINNYFSPAAYSLGKIGVPAPVKELSSRIWDVIVVGAGHNGLACATYLARAGKHVSVCVSCRPAASIGYRRTESATARLCVVACCEWPFCAVSRWQQHSAVG